MKSCIKKICKSWPQWRKQKQPLYIQSSIWGNLKENMDSDNGWDEVMNHSYLKNKCILWWKYFALLLEPLWSVQHMPKNQRNFHSSQPCSFAKIWCHNAALSLTGGWEIKVCNANSCLSSIKLRASGTDEDNYRNLKVLTLHTSFCLFSFKRFFF